MADDLCAELREGCYTDGCSDTKERAATRIEQLEALVRLAADTIDEADNIIAVNCGIDTPREWDRAFAKFGRARQALASRDELQG